MTKFLIKLKKYYENDDENTKSNKYIMNAIFRENGQRNYLFEGLKMQKMKI